MINIFHVGAAGLVVATFLVGYGVQEETQAKLDRVAELKRERSALQTDIALLETEWRRLNSPDALEAVLARVDADETRRLGGATPDRLVAAHTLPVRGEVYDFRHGEILDPAEVADYDAAYGFRSAEVVTTGSVAAAD